MITGFEGLSPKNIHYFDRSTGITRGQYIAFARAINNARIIRGNWDDWILELGDEEDRNNTEALATWVSKQTDVLADAEKRDRVKYLRRRFKKTMNSWMQAYLNNGFERY